MKSLWLWLSILYGCFITSIVTVTLPIVDEDIIKPQDGRICGFGDMNKDRYTDLIVLNNEATTLTVLIQGENGKFTPSEFDTIRIIIPASNAICTVADFNGDALPDIMFIKVTLIL